MPEQWILNFLNRRPRKKLSYKHINVCVASSWYVAGTLFMMRGITYLHRLQLLSEHIRTMFGRASEISLQIAIVISFFVLFF